MVRLCTYKVCYYRIVQTKEKAIILDLYSHADSINQKLFQEFADQSILRKNISRENDIFPR
jgi:hypothetical protein